MNDNIEWVQKYNDKCRKEGNQQYMMSTQRTYPNKTCDYCGSKFHKYIYSGISFAVYECKCGRQIKVGTGYSYDG